MYVFVIFIINYVLGFLRSFGEGSHNDSVNMEAGGDFYNKAVCNLCNVKTGEIV